MTDPLKTMKPRSIGASRLAAEAMSKPAAPRYFDLSDLQTEDGRDRCGTNGCCVLCGRKVNKSTKKTVECGDGGLMAVHNEDEITDMDPGYMGVFDVGPHCARKIPADFLKPGDY